MFVSVGGPTGLTGATGPQGPQGPPGAFTNRGDPNGPDFVKANFTIDNLWHDLDLSGIVGAASKLVLIRGLFTSNTAGVQFLLKTKGNVSAWNGVTVFTQRVSGCIALDMWLCTDANGYIQYYVQNTGTWSVIQLTIGGWF